jgi:hypothetical protein
MPAEHDLTAPAPSGEEQRENRLAQAAQTFEAAPPVISREQFSAYAPWSGARRRVAGS